MERERFTSYGALNRDIHLDPKDRISYDDASLEVIIKALEDIAKSGSPIPSRENIENIAALYGRKDSIIHIGPKGGQSKDFWRIEKPYHTEWPLLLATDLDITKPETSKNAEFYRQANSLNAIGFTWAYDWPPDIDKETINKLREEYLHNAPDGLKNKFDTDIFIVVYNNTHTIDKDLRSTDPTIAKQTAETVIKFLGKMFEKTVTNVEGQVEAQLYLILDLCKDYVQAFPDARRRDCLMPEINNLYAKLDRLDIRDTAGAPLVEACFTPLDLRLVHIAGSGEEGHKLSWNDLAIFDDGIRKSRIEKLWPREKFKNKLPTNASLYLGDPRLSCAKLEQNIKVHLENIDSGAYNYLINSLSNFKVTNILGEYDQNGKKQIPNQILANFIYGLGIFYNTVLQEREAKYQAFEAKASTDRALETLSSIKPAAATT